MDISAAFQISSARGAAKSRENVEDTDICEVDFVDIAAENFEAIKGAYHLVRDRLSEEFGS